MGERLAKLRWASEQHQQQQQQRSGPVRSVRVKVGEKTEKEEEKKKKPGLPGARPRSFPTQLDEEEKFCFVFFGGGRGVIF